METQIKKDIIHYLRTKDLVTLARLINKGVSAKQLQGYVGKLGKDLLGEDNFFKLMYELDEEFVSHLDEPFYDWIDAEDGWSLLTPELQNIVRRSEWLRIDSEWGIDSGFYPFVFDLPEEPWWWDFIEDEQDMFIEDLYYIG